MKEFERYRDFVALLKQKTGILQQSISGDTLFGKFAWSLIELYGKEILISVLEKHIKEPVIVFSGLFPKDWIPAPVFSFFSESLASSADYRTIKEAKKLKFIPINKLNDFLHGPEPSELKEIVRMADDLVYFDETMHVSLSRLDGTAIEGKLFSQSEYWFKGEIWLFIRVEESFAKEFELREVLNYMFLTGIGAKKSTGKGCFELIELKETDLLMPEDSHNAFLSLNRWVPNRNDPSEGFYRIYAKNARLGGNFSVAGIFQKKPILMIEEGSWFYTDKQRPWFGKAIERVQLNEAVIEENVIQSTYCLPLYFKADRVGVSYE